MSDKSFSVGSDASLVSYITTLFQPMDAGLKGARDRATQAGLPEIQVGPMDGRHLECLTRMMNARKVVEIGTLGGYSGLCFLRGMGATGYLNTFEISEVNASVASKTFEAEGFSGRYKVWVGQALKRLKEIESEGPFDLVFIDADKENYPHYLKWAEVHLRRGGVVLGDNTFAFGRLVPGTGTDTPSVQAIREFNRSIAEDGVFRGTILPTGEGLTLGVKL